jgi:hypothetical protein
MKIAGSLTPANTLKAARNYFLASQGIAAVGVEDFCDRLGHNRLH